MMISGIYPNIVRLAFSLLLINIFVVDKLTAQNSDIHSAQVIKQNQRINRIADSLSMFQYSQALSYCLEQISKLHYSNKPDLYSDMLYKAGIASFQMAKIKTSDSLMNHLLKLQIKNIHPILQARILNNKSRAAIYFDRKVDAIKYAKEGLIIYEQNENTKGQLTGNTILGAIYLSMSRYDISYKYFDEAIRISKKANNKKEYLLALLYSIQVLTMIEDLDKIQEILTIADELIVDISDMAVKGRVAYNQGKYYYLQNNYIKAKDSFDVAIKYFMSTNMLVQASSVNTWKAAVAVKLKNYEEAVQLNRLASHLRSEANSYYLQASSQYNMANSLIYLKKYDSALYYINEGEKLYKPFKNKPDYVRGMDLQSNIYIAKGEYDKAFAALEEKMNLQDSLFSAQNKRKIKELESDFVMDQFEQIKEEMLAAGQIQKLENKRNALILNIVLVILFLVFVASILLIVHLKSKNKRNVIIASQKLIFIQMNSHFVFNALTAIQSLIYKNHLESAIYNLTIFTSLINKIMGGTQKKFISLQTEIEFVYEFLKMQKLRFGDLLRYQVNIDETIDLKNTMVPPMLTYPFIEYAVEERVQKASINGMLIINIKDDDKHINYEIVDKDIGFLDMENCFIKRYGGQEILCEQLTKERISVYNKILNPRIIFAEKKEIIEGKEYKALQFRMKK